MQYFDTLSKIITIILLLLLPLLNNVNKNALYNKNLQIYLPLFKYYKSLFYQHNRNNIKINTKWVEYGRENVMSVVNSKSKSVKFYFVQWWDKFLQKYFTCEENVVCE